jgi:hypothetical protein
MCTFILLDYLQLLGDKIARSETSSLKIRRLELCTSLLVKTSLEFFQDISKF